MLRSRLACSLPAFGALLSGACAPRSPAWQVDDSRETLDYAVRELQADIVAQEAALAAEGRPVPPTHLGVYVIHNKCRPKKGRLPAGVPQFVAQVGGGGGACHGPSWPARGWGGLRASRHPG